MKYQINIEGMHCTGCAGLIKMTLEDEFKNVEVDLHEKKAEFESDLDEEMVANVLAKSFKDFSQYKYLNLKKI